MRELYAQGSIKKKKALPLIYAPIPFLGATHMKCEVSTRSDEVLQAQVAEELDLLRAHRKRKEAEIKSMRDELFGEPQRRGGRVGRLSAGMASGINGPAESS